MSDPTLFTQPRPRLVHEIVAVTTTHTAWLTGDPSLVAQILKREGYIAVWDHKARAWCTSSRHLPDIEALTTVMRRPLVRLRVLDPVPAHRLPWVTPANPGPDNTPAGDEQ